MNFNVTETTWYFIIIIAMILFLPGCGDIGRPELMTKAEGMCEHHKGVRQYHLSIYGALRAFCRDGTMVAVVVEVSDGAPEK